MKNLINILLQKSNAIKVAFLSSIKKTDVEKIALVFFPWMLLFVYLLYHGELKIILIWILPQLSLNLVLGVVTLYVLIQEKIRAKLKEVFLISSFEENKKSTQEVVNEVKKTYIASLENQDKFIKSQLFQVGNELRVLDKKVKSMESELIEQKGKIEILTKLIK